MEKSGGTFTGDIIVPDEAYDATAWNGSLEVPTKNALRDKIESMMVLSDGDKGDITVSWGTTVWTIDNNVVSNAKLAQVSTATFKGRTTAWTWNVEDLTSAQATALLSQFSTSAQWVVPSTTSATGKILTDWGWSISTSNYLYKDLTTYTKSNSAWYGTAILSTTIPWWVISSGKGIRIYIKAKWALVSWDSIIKVTLGGTDVNSVTVLNTATTAVREIDYIILGTGSAAQDSYTTYWWDQWTKTSTSVNTASDITLSLYIGMSTASVWNITTIYSVLIEKI